MIRIYAGSDPPVYRGSGFVFHTSGELAYVCLPGEGAKLDVKYTGVTRRGDEIKNVPLTPVAGVYRATIFSAPRELLPEPLNWDADVRLRGDDRAVIIVADVLPNGRSRSKEFERETFRSKLSAKSALPGEPAEARARRFAPAGVIENYEGQFTFKQALICDEQGKPLGLLGPRDEYYDRQRAVERINFLDTLALGDIVGFRVEPPADGAAKLRIDLAFTPLGKPPQSLKISAVPRATPEAEKGFEEQPKPPTAAPPEVRLELGELKRGAVDPQLLRPSRSQWKGTPPAAVFFTGVLDAPQVYQDGGGLLLSVSWKDENGRERRLGSIFPAMSKAYLDKEEQLRDERRKAELAAQAATAGSEPTTPPPSGTDPKITPIPAAQLK